MKKSSNHRSGERLLWCAVLWLCIALMPGTVQAQRNLSNRPLTGTIPSNPNETPLSPEDSLAAQKDKKPKKERKPLESYFFNDSIRARKAFAWQVNNFVNDVSMVEIDTALNRLENDYPFFRNTEVGAAYLGNLGAAAIPLSAIDRPNYRNFQFMQGYDCYLFTPQNVRFFNVKVPYTHLAYYNSGQKLKAEEQLHATHAQNISPSTGFNADYKNRGTKGMYARQKSKDKNLSVAFSHTGKRYSLHAGYIYNMGELRNNGGIKYDREVQDTVYDDPANIEVNLNDSKTNFKGNTFFAVQSYGFTLHKVKDEEFSISNKSTIFVGHAIEWTKYYKKYTDTKEKSGDFYQHWYVNPTRTVDSIAESLVDNRFFMQLQPYSRDGVLGLIDAGVGFSHHEFYQFRPDDYLSSDKNRNAQNSFYLYGALRGKFKTYFDWSGNVKYYMAGYRNQDFSVNGKIDMSAFIRKRPITLTASLKLENNTPSYWMENFLSNHYKWSNSFSKELETRFDVTLRVPHIQFEAGVWQSLLTDKIYYDGASLPAQKKGSVSVSGVYLRKDFVFGGIHLNNRVLLQWSSDQEVVPVPLASAWASYYYEFNIVKDVLRVQLGADAFYNTEYYAFGYNPALSQFYNQREKELGGYPQIDLFVNAKWKRMRILVKMQHFNEDMFGDRNYFSVLHYPLNRRMFKLGFSWSFYD